MDKRNVIIQRNYDDGDSPTHAILGTIHTRLNEYDIIKLWEQWQKVVPEPDSDAQFIDWLHERFGIELAKSIECFTIKG